MNPGRATTPQLVTCLLLSGMLILGIVQRSFLPILIHGLFVFGPNCSGSVARPFVEICSLLQKFDRKFRLPANMFGEIELRRPAASGQLFRASNRVIFQARRSIPPSPITFASLRLAAAGNSPRAFTF